MLSVTEDRSIDFAALLTKELTLIGSHAYGSNRRGPEFAAAVDVLGQYSAELAALQTHQFPLPGCKQPSISPPTRPAAR